MVLVVLVLPSILSIYFDWFSVRNWIGQFEKEEDASPAAQVS